MVTAVDQKQLLNENNGVPDVQAIPVQSSSFKIQDVISIGSRYHIIFTLFLITM